jgi:CRISPR/Cas system-associated exonuclease Cas4 (RecB family)
MAIAAYSTAFGTPAPWPDWWSQPFQLRGGHVVVERVRLVEVGLVDGSRAVLFDGTPAQVETFFAEYGRERIAKIAVGGPPTPGMSCASCKQLTTCEKPQRSLGLLGVDAGRAPLRTVSISDLRYYRSCPAQAHLRSLNLPRSYRESEEAELGRAVHGWLEDVHRDGIRTVCGITDMPRYDEQLGERWRLTGRTAHLAVRMLVHHPEVCAFQDPDSITDVRTESRLVFHDTAANAIVIARPDMLYLQDGSWVWREVKTTQKPRWFHQDLLDEFPQLALAVVLLSEGTLGGDPARSRIELEVLRPDGSDIPMIDPTDPERVAKARSVLQQLAQPWRDDEAFEARPGRDCRWCPVSRWCPSFPGEAIHVGGGDP